MGFGEERPENVASLMREYEISARLTFSNSLLRSEHLSDKRCNRLCELFEHNSNVQNGVIIYSELLLEHIKSQYPGFYFVSSTTKVLTNFMTFIGPSAFIPGVILFLCSAGYLWNVSRPCLEVASGKSNLFCLISNGDDVGGNTES